LIEEEELEGIEEHIQEHGDIDDDGNTLSVGDGEPEPTILG
jgi:hypothetical protein